MTVMSELLLRKCNVSKAKVNEGTDVFAFLDDRPSIEEWKPSPVDITAALRIIIRVAQSHNSASSTQAMCAKTLRGPRNLSVFVKVRRQRHIP